MEDKSKISKNCLKLAKLCKTSNISWPGCSLWPFLPGHSIVTVNLWPHDNKIFFGFWKHSCCSDRSVGRLLVKVESYICWFRQGKSRAEIIGESYSRLWHWRGGSFSVLGALIWSSESPRVLAEVLPHYAQCILTLLIAIERYVIVCHATQAKEILSKIRRIRIYVNATILLTGASAYLSYHYWKVVRDPNGYGLSNAFETVGQRLLSLSQN